MRKTWMFVAAFVLTVALAVPSAASASRVAVFGDNTIDNALTAAGHTVTLVTDAQLATPGFLDGFDALVYTRDGFSLGQTLSQAAADNVRAYVRRTVLLNGDFADAVPADAEVTDLVRNSVAWAAATHHGYVGEFNGAFAGLTSNASNLRALALVSGSASGFTGSGIGPSAATPAGASHPVLDGVALPRDPADEDVGAIVSGVAASKVLARYTANNNPAVIASDLDAIHVAVLGDNAIDDALSATGLYEVSLVTDAQLATPGFLDGFDALVYTRDGFSLGASLSQAAADNVKAYVRRTVLLNGDFADAVPADAEVTDLVRNSVAWAAATHHGYVGEFNGAFAGLTSNGSGLRALDLVGGSASGFTGSGIGTIAATPAGAGHPVLAGVALPRDPADEDVGAIVSGVAASKVLARYTANNNPAVIASDLDAIHVAVLGDNAIDDALSATGLYEVSLVTDAQLATPGFLDGFDALVYTRDGFSLGASLSQAAADNVKAYVRRTVLLNGDFADAVPADAEVTDLVRNSVAWAAATHHGYVGEFNGAFAGLTSNGSGLRALDLVGGSASGVTGSGIGTIAATPAGTGHPVLAGVALPRDPADEDVGAIMSGVAASKVLARYTANNNPAVIASDLDAIQVAVLGDNAIDDALSATGLYEVSLVTDAQLATPGFLDGFDALVYTRDGFSLGASLSQAAADNVKAYVRRTVLLNGDFADAVPADAEVTDLVRNSVAWAAATHHGYVGEFNGAFAGLTSNGSGLRALDLVGGSASGFTGSGIGTIAATPTGAGHPVLAGVALPRDPADEDVGAIVSGVAASKVLARYTANNNPAVIASDLDAIKVAVLGDNAIDNALSATGLYEVTLVTDAQLATAGFLDGFDAFVYTRNGFSLGDSLSAAAAANVKAYVSRAVLLNGDFADAVPA